ncbi:MAG TPA: YdeI/OmpD-associated family protein [Acidimicrobiia bacterium]|nr:YdeI/OmpD-associated family protein [Acidimicrobiia bacterium]
MIELPELLVDDAPAWRAWLERSHDEHSGVWLVLHKKGGTVTSLTYDQALDEALCFGWVDGQKGKRDEHSFRQRFTPRRRASPWSARNVGHVARLVESGRMHAAGLAAVDSAKADGRWDAAYQGQSAAQVPADLAEALATNPAATATFEALNAANRYAIIYRLNAVKRAETRGRKLAGFVEMLARGEALHPQK